MLILKINTVMRPNASYYAFIVKQTWYLFTQLPRFPIISYFGKTHPFFLLLNKKPWYFFKKMPK